MPSDTRSRVMDEAVRLFARKGFADTSVAEIERAAGLKPGAGGLYAHFDSKAELLKAAIERAAAITDHWLQTRVIGRAPNDVDEQQFIEAWVDLTLCLAPPRKRR